MDEFELIRRYFLREAGADVVVGIGDDAAVIDVPDGEQLVTATDTIVEGVHYPSGLDPADIGYRLAAVNFSDMAAMAATPRWMLLSLNLPSVNHDWLDAFASGLFEAASQHEVVLVGGDTTGGMMPVMSLQVIGTVKSGKAVLRSGANAGDGIYVTGNPGDAAGGLDQLQLGHDSHSLCRSFLRPASRVKQALSITMSSAIDVSDGLYADLQKLLYASDCGAELHLDNLPLSRALLDTYGSAKARQFALTGGDDYELCFTAASAPYVDSAPITWIGSVTSEPGIRCLDAGRVVEFHDTGYRHFS
ncbi:MAG: thiamine-phosphate kinase [Pseudomonadota bacterium]